MSHKEEVRLSPAGKAAALALTEVQKAIRFFRLYPRDHPFCTRSIEEAHTRLDGFFQKHGPLEVEIQQEGLAMDEQVVLAGSDQSSDLSSLLYPEGIRELSIEPGLPAEELFDFAVILSAHYPEGTGGEEDEAQFGNDLLTALWKRDFGHIEYRIHDQLSLRAVRTTNDPDLDAVARRIDGLFQALKREEAPPEELDVEAFLRQLEAQSAAGQLDDLANWASDPERVDEFLESTLGADRKRLIEELHDPFMGDVLVRASDIVVWTTVQREGAPDQGDVARFLVGSTLSALGKGEVEQASELLEKVVATDEERRQLLPVVTARLSTAPSLQALAKALDARRPAVDPEELTATGIGYLGHLEDAAIQGACEVYPELAQDAVRRVFRRYLSARVDRGTDAIARLTSHENKQVVREAVGMLALGGEGSQARKLLEEVVRSGEDTARATVAREVLDTVTGERARKKLLEVAVSDPDKRRRLLAVRKLKDEAGPTTFDDLREVVSAPDFAQREEDEMHMFLDALTSLGGLRAVKVLQDLAARRSLLFGRKDAQRLRTLAEAWLRSLRDKQRANSRRHKRPGGDKP